jgi:hypothetical protein
MRFVGQHPLLSSATPLALLATYLFDPRALGGHLAGPHLLDFVQQESPCQKPVETLLPCRLAFYLKARGTMN